MNVTRWWKRCGRFEAAISLRALGMLEGAEAAALDAHLAGCPRCRARLVESGLAAGAIEDWATGAPRSEPGAGLRRRWVREVGARAGADAAGGRIMGPSLGGRTGAGWRAWSGERWAWTAAAAAWGLMGVLRFAAPDAIPVPAGAARADTTVAWRSVVLVLRGERPEAQRGPAEAPPEPGRGGASMPGVPHGSVGTPGRIHPAA